MVLRNPSSAKDSLSFCACTSVCVTLLKRKLCWEIFPCFTSCNHVGQNARNSCGQSPELYHLMGFPCFGVYHRVRSGRVEKSSLPSLGMLPLLRLKDSQSLGKSIPPECLFCCLRIMRSTEQNLLKSPFDDTIPSLHFEGQIPASLCRKSRNFTGSDSSN